MVIALIILLLAVCAVAMRKKENAYALLLEGGAEGLKILIHLIPALVLRLTAVSMLRSSGAVELISRFFAPVFRFFGIPPETAPLIFLRPVTGSGALAVGSELTTRFGPDSYIGRCAAALLGSTETTFYVIAVYFGAAGIQKTRYTLPAALFADLVGFTVAALTARLFF